MVLKFSFNDHSLPSQEQVAERFCPKKNESKAIVTNLTRFAKLLQFRLKDWYILYSLESK